MPIITEWNDRVPSKRTVETHCEVCGSVFMKFPGKHRVRYCSPKCVGAARKRPLIERFLNHFAAGTDDECWLFDSLASNGYGVIGGGGPENKQILAHRYALELKLGRKLNEGEHALHSCDVRACVNPAHLRAGSQFDNQHDAMDHGRHTRGEMQGLSKLREHQVVEIRRLREDGETLKIIANQFGVSIGLVWFICKRKYWKHVA